MQKGYQSHEQFILAILHHLSKWNLLVSFGVINAVLTKETLSEGVHQWVMKNSNLIHGHNSFVVDSLMRYFDCGLKLKLLLTY
jgi:hypothetical protein